MDLLHTNDIIWYLRLTLHMAQQEKANQFRALLTKTRDDIAAQDRDSLLQSKNRLSKKKSGNGLFGGFGEEVVSKGGFSFGASGGDSQDLRSGSPGSDGSYKSALGDRSTTPPMSRGELLQKKSAWEIQRSNKPFRGNNPSFAQPTQARESRDGKQEKAQEVREQLKKENENKIKRLAKKEKEKEDLRLKTELETIERDEAERKEIERRDQEQNEAERKAIERREQERKRNQDEAKRKEQERQDRDLKRDMDRTREQTENKREREEYHNQLIRDAENAKNVKRQLEREKKKKTRDQNLLNSVMEATKRRAQEAMKFDDLMVDISGRRKRIFDRNGIWHFAALRIPSGSELTIDVPEAYRVRDSREPADFEGLTETHI